MDGNEAKRYLQANNRRTKPARATRAHIATFGIPMRILEEAICRGLHGHCGVPCCPNRCLAHTTEAELVGASGASTGWLVADLLRDCAT